MRQSEFLFRRTTGPQGIRQPINDFRRLAMGGQDGLERLDLGGLAHTGHGTIGAVCIDNPALGIRDDYTVGFRIQKSCGKRVAAAARHDHDETDDR